MKKWGMQTLAIYLYMPQLTGIFSYGSVDAFFVD